MNVLNVAAGLKLCSCHIILLHSLTFIAVFYNILLTTRLCNG